MRLLRIKEVLARVGYSSPVTLYNLERRGLFPARRRIGPNRVGWLESEIDAWIADRARGIGADVKPAASA